MDLTNEENTKPTIAAIHELSKRIRSGLTIIFVLLGLLAVVLYAHKPSVTDLDLASTVYTRELAEAMHSACQSDITKIFEQRRKDYDHPWKQIAESYLLSSSKDDKSTSLCSFLNVDGDGLVKQRHLLSVVNGSNGCRNQLMNYIEESKNKWQQFVIPVIEVRVDKDEVAFYLSIAIASMHLLVVAKREYLIHIRDSNKIKYLPDPSLYTASLDDLHGLVKVEQWTIWVIQIFIFVLIPWLAAILTGMHFITKADFDWADHTRLGVGFVVLFIDAVSIFLLYFWWNRLRTAKEFKHLCGLS